MKKIGKIFIVLLIVLLYFNVGYWSGKSAKDAYISYYHNEPLNAFQKFQFVNGWIYKVDFAGESTTEQRVFKLGQELAIVGVFLWPVALFVIILGWIIYGIVCAVIGIWIGIVFLATNIWIGIVFLWKLFFTGGLLKLTGLANEKGILIAISLLGTIIGFIYSTNRTAKLWLTVSTVIMGPITIDSALRANGDYFWAFWIFWNIVIIFCFLLNLEK